MIPHTVNAQSLGGVGGRRGSRPSRFAFRTGGRVPSTYPRHAHATRTARGLRPPAVRGSTHSRPDSRNAIETFIAVLTASHRSAERHGLKRVASYKVIRRITFLALLHRSRRGERDCNYYSILTVSRMHTLPLRCTQCTVTRCRRACPVHGCSVQCSCGPHYYAGPYRIRYDPVVHLTSCRYAAHVCPKDLVAMLECEYVALASLIAQSRSSRRSRAPRRHDGES